MVSVVAAVVVVVVTVIIITVVDMDLFVEEAEVEDVVDITLIKLNSQHQ